jgi:hypothetical protein
MDINPDARARIAAAADQLFEQSGRTAFPTVDAVRRLSKTNMSDASAAMKEWRRGQAATAAPVAVAVPARVQQASQAAIAALWAEAQEIANDALKAAQGAWEAEREEAEALRREMSAAFEAQAAETEALQARLAAMEAQAATTAAELAEARLNLAHTRGQLDASQTQQAALLAAMQTSAEKSDDTRKAAMVGAAILAKVERGEWPEDKMLAMMDATLTEAGERTLFGLDGKKPKEEGKPPAKPRAAKARNLDIEDTGS